VLRVISLAVFNAAPQLPGRDYDEQTPTFPITDVLWLLDKWRGVPVPYCIDSEMTKGGLAIVVRFLT